MTALTDRHAAPVPAVPTPAPRLGARRLVASACAIAGLSMALGASLWLVLAAAERRSVLSPPTLRSPQPWLYGPLHGLLPHLSTSVPRLQTDLDLALLVLFAGWLVAWAAAPALPTATVATAVAGVQVVFLLGPPQPVTDAFNYLVYGRMAVRGINPYTNAPVAGPHDTAYALSNWHHLPSPYGPLFTLLTEPLARLRLPAASWAWKLIVVASSLAVLGLVWWLARFGRSPQRALVFAGLCPVTLAIGIGGFHNDLPAVLAVVGSAACLVRACEVTGSQGRWDAAAGALAVTAAGLKPPFAVVIALVVLGADRRLAALAGAMVTAAVVAAVTLVAFGGALPSLGAQGALVTPLSVPNLLGLAAGHGGADATVRGLGRDSLVVIVLIASALVAWRRRWAVPALGVVLLLSVFTLSWSMSWYLAWALPFAALARPRVLVPLSIVTCVWLGLAGTPAHGTSSHAAAAGPFGGVPPRTPTTDTSTGFILDRAGDVMTAAHVVDGASSIRITLQNGTSYRATLLGEDNSTDVAILKIDSPPATLQLGSSAARQLGSSAALSVGAPIAAIGDPYALDRSLSTGIVSGLDRTIQAPSGFTVAHAIQTNAALNPGNSGGPILAANGSVIGIADQIATNGADQNSGVGFAVPIDIARSEMVALENGQQVKHTYLGIGTETATGSTTGALVGQVVPNGPAATAGIKTGDVITAINSTTITNPNSLVAAISSAKPGDKVTMTVKRGATTETLTMTLGTQPAQTTTAAG